MRWPLLAALLSMPGCTLFRHAPDLAADPHYVVGAPYQAGGVWYYPAEHTQYAATGLAAVAAGRRGATADGEAYDPTALAAAHQTLQLPSVARVTNLENGRQVLLRLNDRGPDAPSRLLALTPHAAELLQARDGTRVRMELDEDMTRAVADPLGGGPKVAVAVAPRGSVQAESLAPPAGAAQSGRVRQAAATGIAQASAADGAAAVPLRLPDAVVQGAAEPGQLFIRASEFGRADYAGRFASLIGGTVERQHVGRSDIYRVVAGPYASPAEADAALDRALRSGVIDARIVVQ